MTSRWDELSRLFEEAAELDDAGRERFLRLHCSTDTDLESDVRTLLAHHRGSTGPVATGSAALLAPDADAEPVLAVHSRVGAWRVVRELGHGGMGQVFLVERADGDFRQFGALKLLRAGLWTEEMIRRLRRERQILAGLDHPNIARLLDGGATAEGMPFFVMEYVDGEPLLEWATARSVPLRQRVRLFLDVCAAVQSAHQRLVLHRDLKPANVLVTGEGVPKLLDFGIAKLFDEEGDELRTLYAPLTPGYASPEQLAGRPVTTASDVYSLGVMLLEILTGLRASSPPQRPSDTRGLSPALRRQLAGDLDTIVSRAVEADPWRRFGSVEALAEDLRRWLEGRPVLARPDSLAYRARRFARRNLASVVASGVAVLALVAGLVAALWQARVAQQERDVARRRFEEVRGLARGIVFPIYDAIENLPGATEARKLVVEHALRYLDPLYRESGGDPGLERELATAYRKIGDVQGRAFYGNLGESEKSVESYRRSFELFERAAEAQPESLSNREVVAAGHRMTEVLRKTGHHEEAMRYASEARLQLDALLRRFPDEEILQKDLNISCDRLADGYLAADDTASAIAQRRQGLEVIEALYRKRPDEPRYLRGIVVDCLKSADLLGATGDQAAANTLYRRAEEAARTRAAADANDAEAQRDLSIVYSKFAVFLSWGGEIDSAMATYEKAQKIAEAMSAADPSDASMRFDVYAGHYEMGTILDEGKRWGEAARRFRVAYDGFAALAREDPSDADSRVSVGDAAFRAGRAYARLAAESRSGAERSRLRQDAIEWMRRGVAEYRSLASEERLSKEQQATLSQMSEEESKVRTSS